VIESTIIIILRRNVPLYLCKSNKPTIPRRRFAEKFHGTVAFLGIASLK